MTQALDRLIDKARALDTEVAMYLMIHPSARIAHHRNSLIDALQREKAALAEEAVKTAAREERRAANAEDRARRSAEPHELRAAERMGFGSDVRSWRQYINEREDFRDSIPYVEGAEFPSPEEWRAKR